MAKYGKALSSLKEKPFLPNWDAMKTRRFLVVVMLLFVSVVPLWADDDAAYVDAIKNRAAQGNAEAQFDLARIYDMG